MKRLKILKKTPVQQREESSRGSQQGKELHLLSPILTGALLFSLSTSPCLHQSSTSPTIPTSHHRSAQEEEEDGVSAFRARLTLGRAAVARGARKRDLGRAGSFQPNQPEIHHFALLCFHSLFNQFCACQNQSIKLLPHLQSPFIVKLSI